MRKREKEWKGVGRNIKEEEAEGSGRGVIKMRSEAEGIIGRGSRVK